MVPKKIDAKEGKSFYFQQMETFSHARAIKRCEKELHVPIRRCTPT
jgi:hypothetical protein